MILINNSSFDVFGIKEIDEEAGVLVQKVDEVVLRNFEDFGLASGLD